MTLSQRMRTRISFLSVTRIVTKAKIDFVWGRFLRTNDSVTDEVVIARVTADVALASKSQRFYDI